MRRGRHHRAGRLSAPAGAEDTRTKDQRYHDALHDAMRRLVTAGLLPDGPGSRSRPGPMSPWPSSAPWTTARSCNSEWIGEMAIRWAARRAAASQTGSDGAAWLNGKPARAVSCDAMVIPVVTGQIDPGALDDLVSLCLQYAATARAAGPSPPPGRQPGPQDARSPAQPSLAERAGPGGVPRAPADLPARPHPPTPQALEMLRMRSSARPSTWSPAPAGSRASCAPGSLDARLAGPSLPLDVGHSAEIPAAIRRAVILRDQHCRWAGGCDQPASACEVHHVTHLADGGTTSVDGCAPYCFFHHQVAIHQWGWKVALHPDGTTTARSPDGTKVFRSHGPPARAG